MAREERQENGEGRGRRQFLTQMAAAGASAVLMSSAIARAADKLKPWDIENPLSKYPNRGWEKVYRNLYESDSSYTFLCAPNDTHNCLMRAHVKNGVVTRISPTYGYQKATDLGGKSPGQRWDPRCCQKGLALVRRFYGDRRCKKPMIRKGFKDWADADFPRDATTGAVDLKYVNRGRDTWVAATWEEAFEYSGKALTNIARTYTGEKGKRYLLAQGYDKHMVEAMGGAGTQVLKFRGGMPPLGMTRVFAQYRLANSMALLDDKIRGKGQNGSVGARGWDNYSWHTDLPPGHPMVTGSQTNDFDLCAAEHSNIAILWGMNFITTKMPAAHWWTEARMKGTKIVVIACEYSASSSKADEALIVRPGTTPALSLGFAQVIMSQKLYDETWIKRYTDLPMLIRMDNGDLLREKDVAATPAAHVLTNNTVILGKGQKGPPIHGQKGAVITKAQLEKWGTFVMWDSKTDAPVAVNRDKLGKHFDALGIDPKLEGTVKVTLTDGKEVECRTVFDVTKQMLDQSYTPKDVEKITWAPANAIESLAREIAANPGKTLFFCGMGPNQFFNSDLKDRGIFLVAALTRSVGQFGGNVGSYAGNYRASYFNGLPQYIGENPFDIELDPKKPARSKTFWKAESAHYYNHGDHILKMGEAVLTGKTHMPTPSKSICVSNSNSLIGNAKGHYESVVNLLPKIEYIGVNEWWWTASCEYADVVFPVDSWAEFRYPDMTISVTNPFLYVFPTSKIPRIHDTRSDMDVAAGLGKAVGKATGDTRHDNYWKFIDEGGVRPYIQRILDHSSATRGNTIEDLEKKAMAGVPALLEARTYPKCSSWEQVNEDVPWHTRSGRLEFYRDEQEFKDSGENVVVHREPIDSTFHEPNVIVAKPHPLLKPKSPEDYGVSSDDLSAETRQARHVIRTVDEMIASKHPLMKDGDYRFIFHTPKYRHGAHTTPVDTDIVAVWFGPFGDMHRADKRAPFVSELYIDMNPLDAKALKIEDGDYVWIDADPSDRPFKGWQKNPEAYKIARLMARCRYYPGTPQGVTRMWHNSHGATYGSVEGAEKNANGMAKSPHTGYQSLLRFGSHQSCTRSWLKPTWMTDSLTVKGLLGQKVTAGFVPDVHCPTGAPREAFVKITKAEDGGIDGKGLWAAAKAGLRPTYENDLLKKHIAAEFVKKT